jgi:hypothetical protein
MQTTLPDLPFDPRGIVTAAKHSSSNSTPCAYPRTDFRLFEPWQTFNTDIHTAITDAMATKGIVDGTDVIARDIFRREPKRVHCEEDIHEAANTELHEAVRDVLQVLGVEGEFVGPESLETQIFAGFTMTLIIQSWSYVNH